MANTIENTFQKIGNTLETIFGGGRIEQPETNVVNSEGKPSNLEMFGIQARGYHLMRNEWRKDIQYTRALVGAEYMIQNEFPIGNTDASVKEQVAAAKKKEEEATKTIKDKLIKQLDTLKTKLS